MFRTGSRGSPGRGSRSDPLAVLLFNKGVVGVALLPEWIQVVGVTHPDQVVNHLVQDNRGEVGLEYVVCEINVVWSQPGADLCVRQRTVSGLIEPQSSEVSCGSGARLNVRPDWLPICVRDHRR